MMRAAWALAALHALALVLGLFGMLIAIPHPELWAANPNGAAVYAFAIDKTGGTAMFLGALAMLAFGFAALGARRTLLFFAAATILSAAAELTGTKTGWPFGGYAYTGFLGPKLFGRVPVAVPLSWFYMGFASFVLADAIAVRRAWRRRTLWSIVLGAWLLTAWDLVLDPSMAAPQMQYIHFWVWHESGPYFGMPLRNLAGWFCTGLAFIAIGRAAWRERRAPAAAALLPFAVYAINVVWSMVLSSAAGMWPTALAAVAFSLAPAALALAPRAYPSRGMAGPPLIAAWSLRTQAERVDVGGLEHVPASGPVLIVAHHYHNLLDGAVVTAHLRRPVHIVVGLDWAATAMQRRWMERACRWARYPVLLRPATIGSSAAYAAGEVARYLRSGVRDAAALLRAGRVVLVFPEGYPVVDPTAGAATPRDRDADGFLPFAQGFRAIARLAGNDVAIVPLGFRYVRIGRRWRIAARFGAPLPCDAPLAEVERAVRALSAGATPSRS